MKKRLAKWFLLVAKCLDPDTHVENAQFVEDYDAQKIGLTYVITKKDIKVIFCIAKKSESRFIFDLIDEIDPNAFVAQSAVVGVYGQGFDRVKAHHKINLTELREKLAKERELYPETTSSGH